jgi:CBS domain containing-hemolysin-like protein
MLVETGMLPTLLKLGVVLALVAANGMFVAAEFAIVSVRRARLAPLLEGSKTARFVQKTAENPNTFLAATQLGITMASLGLGWVGEPMVGGLLEPLLAYLPLQTRDVARHAVATALAFGLITTLHIVFGELAAKSIALWRPESTALIVAPPTDIFYRLFRPFIWMLNSIANATLSLFGLRAPAVGHVHSPEEIQFLVSESREAGVMEEDQALLMHRVFKFTDRSVGEVMVPRVSLQGVPKESTVMDAIDRVRRSGYTRLPVFADDLDHIVGMVHARDLLLAHADGRGLESVDKVMRPVLFVPETKPIADLLQDMRHKRIHLAVVLDEYGGTAGIVTLEDLLEELVGEIPAEFRPERRLIIRQSPDAILVDAAVSLDQLNESFGVDLPLEAANTLGGFIVSHLRRIPEMGETFQFGNLEFRIESARGNRIELVRIRKVRGG